MALLGGVRILARPLVLGLALTLGCGGRQERSGGNRGGAEATGGETSLGGATASGGATPSGGAVSAGANALGGVGNGGAPVAGAVGSGGYAGNISTDPLPYCTPPAGGGAFPGCAAGQECRINLAGILQCAKCGGPSEPCCATMQACRDQGCCVDRKCIPENTECAVMGSGSGQSAGTCKLGECTGCGQLAQVCCGRSELGPGCAQDNLVCQLGPTMTECVRCGGPNELCCAHNACRDGACCSPSSENLDSLRCIPAGDMCQNGSTCSDQSCGGCGRPGQPCCADPRPNYLGHCTTPFTDCNAPNGDGVYVCEACGVSGQQPCHDGGCQSGERVASTGLCK
ncbi:MAG TPA: hypothetical protein VG937_00940 [Polyangiaceae bacterium]|nr:hypothetical protein [Polyangiaceae bacterium]